MKLQDQLQGILHDLSFVSTETSLMIGAIVLLLVGLTTKKVTLIKALFGIVLIVGIAFNLQQKTGGYFLSQSLFADAEIVGFASLFLVFGMLLLIFPRSEHGTEFYFLVLSLLVGSFFMMKANNLLLVYLSIELVSFVSYVLTGFTFKKEGFEASIKYLLVGAISSALMLVGIGLVYGTAGGFYLSDWTEVAFSSLISQVGLLLVLCGLFFKIALFPFHIWTPATYQSATVDAVTIFSVVPKLAGLILLKRMLFASGFGFDHWLPNSILILAMITILLGTLGALKQANTRRMISFGSIAHTGFLLGFVVLPTNLYNQEAFWWYALVYGLMNFGAFYLVDRFEANSIIKNQDYQKLYKETWVGAMFTLLLVSLVGLPPLAGFTAKLFLFSTLWASYLDTGSFTEISFLSIAVLATVASLFFYLKVPKNIFLSEKNSDTSGFQLSLSTKIIATIFGITMLIMFFVPELVMSLQSLLNNLHE